MSEPVIQVENLGKKYIISHEQPERYTALRDVLSKQGKAIAHNLLSAFRKTSPRRTRTREEFWALQHISFSVEQGEVIGIIGRNGAGKSTLLKILSRITEPTIGRIALRGRVASLLEVGTGFHPELTGRENIYLNGAILGMTRTEIRRKFDEIVAFAEVERFLDTPVKRYSSGMYVRLAFAVAANLEPEILLVDEVLAVGDANFQQKCLGKMGEVSEREGRTVFFVSHSMASIARLTKRCILLDQGNVQFDGSTNQAISLYSSNHREGLNQCASYKALSSKSDNHLASVQVLTSEDGLHHWGQSITFEFDLHITNPTKTLYFSFQIIDESQRPICYFSFVDSQAPDSPYPLGALPKGIFRLTCQIPKFRLYMGSYTLMTWLAEHGSNHLIEHLSNICPFVVTMQNVHRHAYDWKPNDCTYLEDAIWKPAHLLERER